MTSAPTTPAHLEVEVEPLLPDPAAGPGREAAPQVAGQGTVATSAVSQFGAKCIHFALNAISTLAIIRYLGPERYGDYVFVITASFVIGILSDMGLNNIAVREISRDPSREDHVIGGVILTRLSLGVGAWLLTLGVVRLLGGSGELLVAAGIISILYFTEAVLALVIRFHVRVQQQYEALVRVVMETFETVLVIVLVVRGASLIAILAAPPLAAFVGIALTIVVVRRRYGPLPRLHTGETKVLLREALPVGLTLLLAAAYLRSPALVVASTRGSADAGLYGAAYQPVEYLLLASAVVINVLLPLLSRAWVGDHAHFVDVYRRATEALLALTIPIVIVIVVAGPALVQAVFGDDFAASATPLRLLGLALVPMIMSFWHSVVLLAGGQQRLTLAYDLLAFALTLALSFVLIPDHGPTGAAIAVLATSVVVVGCAVAATGVRLRARPAAGRLAVIAALGIVTGAAALVLNEAGLPPILTATVAALAYGGAIWALGLAPSPHQFDLARDPDDGLHDRSAGMTPTPASTDELPFISVIFPTYNRCDVVETTIDHLLAQDYPTDRFEILVCDNSSDGTPEMVERVAATAEVPVTLMASTERLPAVKRNQGLRAARGEIVLFLNDDVWVVPTFLREHAAAHAASTAPVAVLGRVAQSPAMPQTPFISWYEPFAYAEIADRAGRTVPYNYSWSMNLSFPHDEMLDRNLVFHEDWANIGHEDVELGFRWASAGNEVVYQPGAFGEHFHPHGLTSACGVQEAVGRGLRDLEVLVDDPGLLERYGIFSWRNSTRAVVRGTARRALFNRFTVPRLLAWLEAQERNTALTTWMYWKVLLHHTDRGYREQAPRHPVPTPFTARLRHDAPAVESAPAEVGAS